MSRIVILRKWDPLMPIFFPGVMLLELYEKDGKVGFARKAFNGEIPKSAHEMQQMDDPNEKANAVCNVCMKEGVEWVCANSKHVPIEPLGFHLCKDCYIRIQDNDDTLRMPVANATPVPTNEAIISI